MIKLTLCENNNTFTSFKVEGHSLTAKKGNNLICAGVSTLSQTIILGIKTVLNIKVDLNKNDGYLYCKMPSKLTNNDINGINLLIMTMIAGFDDLKQQYPDEIEIVWHNNK